VDKDAPAATAAPAVTAVTATPAASPSRGAGTADSRPASPEGGGGVSVVLTGSLKMTGFLSWPNEADGDGGAATFCGVLLNLLLLLPSPGDRGRGVTCGLEGERRGVSTYNYCIGRKG
jgi:hypothetical protein